MKKNKIADSIIIRVGGGIREVRRETADIPEMPDTVETNLDVEGTEDLQTFPSGLGSLSAEDKKEVVN
jgi:hypothetical protein